METRLEVPSQSVAAPPQFARSALRLPLPHVASVHAGAFRDVLALRIAGDAPVRLGRTSLATLLALEAGLTELLTHQDAVLPDGRVLEALAAPESVNGQQAEDLLLRAAQRRGFTVLCCGEGDEPLLAALRIRRTLPRTALLGSLRMDGATATAAGRAGLVARIGDTRPDLLICHARSSGAVRTAVAIASAASFRHAVFRVS